MLPTNRLGWEVTPIWAVARRSRSVPLRFTSRDLRRASQEPHEKGTGGLMPARSPDGAKEMPDAEDARARLRELALGLMDVTAYEPSIARALGRVLN